MEKAAGFGIQLKEFAIEQQGERLRVLAKGIEGVADETDLVGCHN